MVSTTSDKQVLVSHDEAIYKRQLNDEIRVENEKKNLF